MSNDFLEKKEFNQDNVEIVEDEISGKQRSPIEKVVSFSLANRGNNARFDLSKGFNKSTEHYAYKFVIPHTGVEDMNLLNTALRVSSLIALTKIPQTDKISFGKFAKKYSSKGDIEGRLLRIVSLKQEEAFKEVRRIMNIIGEQRTGFNWYDFARNFQYWGQTTSDKTLKVRQQFIKDFYLSNTKTEEEERK